MPLPTALITAVGMCIMGAEHTAVVQRGTPSGCWHDGTPLVHDGEECEVGGDLARVWLAAAPCYDWQPAPPHCADSRLTVRLICGTDVEVTLHGEAANRLLPMRDVVSLGRWRWHPADLNRDGARTRADLALWMLAPFDWDGDGWTDHRDYAGLIAAYGWECEWDGVP